MLTKEFILKNKISISNRSYIPPRGSKKSYVYFLINNDEIIYIGQSYNINQRISQHINSKKFNYYYLLSVVREQLLDVEKKYIEQFKPKYNKLMRDNYNNRPVVMRIDTGLYSEVKNRAMIQGVTVTEIFNKALEEYLKM